VRVISVVTAAYQPVPEYLHAAYTSLASQELPGGWAWQWVVQEDGQTGDVAHLLPDDPRISPGSGRRGGECVTRTMCLARANGELIKVLDADDMLTPGTLAREIDVMAAHPDIGWTTCRVLDLHSDGSTSGFEFDPPEGHLPRGMVLQHWRTHDYRAPVHPVTLCLRRELVLALGGWMALPASGDTGLLMAADAISGGYFIASAGLLYRKWPGQATTQPAHTDPGERQARYQIIEERARALGLLWMAPDHGIRTTDGPVATRSGVSACQRAQRT
jgi:glycosyltransferase involved in cell wall biosynthesis